MKNRPTTLHLEYLGIVQPQSPNEIEFEILGLESAITEAKHKIAQLKQGLALAKLVIEGREDDHNPGESRG